MALKDNILKKINIKAASKIVNESLSSSPESRIDRQNAIFLLETAGYKHQHLRDIDMYFKGIDRDNARVIVLDSEFATYKTSIEDIAIRKSPTIKEMLNLGNIKKILWDENVKIEKKMATLETITREALDSLDISVTKSEIEEIMYQAMASLSEKHTEGIRDGILVFSCLLGLESPLIKINPTFLVMAKKITGDQLYGPTISYSHNLFRICFSDNVYDLNNPEQKALFEKFTSECEGACLTGEEVFRKLCEMVKFEYKI